MGERTEGITVDHRILRYGPHPGTLLRLIFTLLEPREVDPGATVRSAYTRGSTGWPVRAAR